MKRAITTREAAAADIDNILKVEEACFSEDAFSRRQIAYLILRAKGVFLIALSGDVTVGYISLLTSDRWHTGRIYSLAVRPQYRGAGIAETLLDDAINSARRRQSKAIFLEVRTDNTAAVSLYQKKGFFKRSAKRGYYEDGSDAYSMVLPL